MQSQNINGTIRMHTINIQHTEELISMQNKMKVWNIHNVFGFLCLCMLVQTTNRNRDMLEHLYTNKIHLNGYLFI